MYRSLWILFRIVIFAVECAIWVYKGILYSFLATCSEGSPFTIIATNTNLLANTHTYITYSQHKVAETLGCSNYCHAHALTLLLFYSSSLQIAPQSAPYFISCVLLLHETTKVAGCDCFSIYQDLYISQDL